MIHATKLPFLFLSSNVIFSIALIYFSFPHLAIPFILLSVIALMDCRARARDYLKHRNKKLNDRVLRAFAASACGREVVKAIALYKINQEYKLLGYRWWHILPDGFPKKVVTKEWWKTLI